MLASKRTYLILWAISFSILAFVILDSWSSRNGPQFKKFERQWAEDVQLLENSKKLPPAWFDVGEVELIGGNPETKSWLRKIHVPVKANRPGGKYKLEVLVVIWEADGKRGALVQYNLVDLKSKNMIAELARTLMLTPQ